MGYYQTFTSLSMSLLYTYYKWKLTPVALVRKPKIGENEILKLILVGCHS